MFEKDLMDWLRADEEMIELHGSFEDHPIIYWLKRPRDAKNTFPATVMRQISPGAILDQKGTDALAAPRIQFDIYSSGVPETARAIVNRLIKMMDIKKDPATGWPGITVGKTHFSSAILEGFRDMPVGELSDGVDIFHISCDFIIWHRPAAQT